MRNICRDKVREVLEKLPAEDARLIELLYFAEATVTDTAKLFGCSRKTIQNHRKRILEELCRKMKDQGIQGDISESTWFSTLRHRVAKRSPAIRYILFVLYFKFSWIVFDIILYIRVFCIKFCNVFKRISFLTFLCIFSEVNTSTDTLLGYPFISNEKRVLWKSLSRICCMISLEHASLSDTSSLSAMTSISSSYQLPDVVLLEERMSISIYSLEHPHIIPHDNKIKSPVFSFPVTSNYLTKWFGFE